MIAYVVAFSPAGIAISFLEVGGLVGSVFSGYITDKLLLKVSY